MPYTIQNPNDYTPNERKHKLTEGIDSMNPSTRGGPDTKSPKKDDPHHSNQTPAPSVELSKI